MPARRQKQEPPSPEAIRPPTFAFVFGQPSESASGDRSRDSWRIRGSGVSRRPERAPWTKAIVAFLESQGVAVERASMMSMIAADSYTVDATFLDGGLSAMTGPYIGGAKGASISGPRAVLFVALGLGLRVPPKFLDRYGLTGVTLEELRDELQTRAPGRND